MGTIKKDFPNSPLKEFFKAGGTQTSRPGPDRAGWSLLRRSLAAAGLLAFFGVGAARASLNFTAVPLGDKTSSPRIQYDFTSSTQNVLMAVQVQNTDLTPQTLSGLTITILSNTNLIFHEGIAGARIYLVHDTDGDGDILTPSGKSRATGFSAQATVQRLPSGTLTARFTASPAVTFAGSSATHLFVVYDSNDVMDDHATIDAQIASPSDVTASAAVALTGAPVNSAGIDTVNVVATTFQIDVPPSGFVQAGVPFDMDIKAADDSGNIDIDATAVVRLTAATTDPAPTSPGGFAPAYPADQAFVNGETTFRNIIFYGAASQVRMGVTWVSGSPNMSSAGTKNSIPFQVLRGPVVLTMGNIPSPQRAGVPFPVQVTGSNDQYGNTSAGSVVQVTAAGPSAASASEGDERAAPLAPAYGAPQSFASGSSTLGFNVTLYKAETGRRLAAMEVVPSTTPATLQPVTSNPFDILNATTDHIHIRPPQQAFAGTPFISTVAIHDAYNNAVVAYMGTIHVQATPRLDTDVLPADWTGAPTGESLPSVTFYSYGTKLLNAHDTAHPATLSSTATLVIALPFAEKTITYPSPYRPRKDGNMNIRFYTDKEGRAKISILSFEGVKVREWNVDSAGLGIDQIKRWTWDGKDESGNDVPSGLYICVTDMDGHVGKTKFGLIR